MAAGSISDRSIVLCLLVILPDTFFFQMWLLNGVVVSVSLCLQVILPDSVHFPLFAYAE